MNEDVIARKTSIFAVRTTAGQEKNVAKLLASRIETKELLVASILVPETLKGYIFREAEGRHYVDQAISGLRHIRSAVPGIVPFSEVEKYIMIKAIVEELDIGYVVEVIGGPFKGMKAKITGIDRSKEEITIELLEASFTLPITIHADYVKIIEKPSEEG